MLYSMINNMLLYIIHTLPELHILYSYRMATSYDDHLQQAATETGAENESTTTHRI